MPEASPEDFVIENGILKEYKGVAERVMAPDWVKEIGYAAFFENETVCFVILPKGVTRIGGNAFMY